MNHELKLRIPLATFKARIFYLEMMAREIEISEQYQGLNVTTDAELKTSFILLPATNAMKNKTDY